MCFKRVSQSFWIRPIRVFPGDEWSQKLAVACAYRMVSTNEGQGNDMYAENDSWAYLEHRANWGVLATTAMMTACRASSGVKGTA